MSSKKILLAENVKISKHKELETTKKPKTKERHIGLEFEFVIDGSRKTVMDALIEAKVDKYCEVADDGSIRDVYCGSDGMVIRQATGLELKVLCKQTQYDRVVPKVLKVLRDLGAWVNDSCGFHVHLDMRERDSAKCYHNLVMMQELLFRMNPADRKDRDGYCKPCPTNALKRRLYLDSTELYGNPHEYRHWAVNHHALKTHGTLEVRIAQGTISTRDAIIWIKLLLLAIRSPKFLKPIATLDDLIRELTLSFTERKAVYERISTYESEHWDNEAA